MRQWCRQETQNGRTLEGWARSIFCGSGAGEFDGGGAGRNTVVEDGTTYPQSDRGVRCLAAWCGNVPPFMFGESGIPTLLNRNAHIVCRLFHMFYVTQSMFVVLKTRRVPRNEFAFVPFLGLASGQHPDVPTPHGWQRSPRSHVPDGGNGADQRRWQVCRSIQCRGTFHEAYECSVQRECCSSIRMSC